jgi:Putative beta-barrel porin 2
LAQINGPNSDLANPAASGPNNLNAPAIPAAVALPVETGTGSASKDASDSRKWYTLTASLREIYDDNVNADNRNRKSSLETAFSPSILVSTSTTDSSFSGRYTFGMNYYGTKPTYSDSPLQLTHEIVAQYSHAFTDRFNLNLAEQFRYYYEPSIQESAGTPYQDGAYFYNAINATFTAQWTPLIGTTTSFSNNLIQYQTEAVSEIQSYVENTGTQAISFAILPKINVSAGFIGDNITYKTDERGYTSYTGFGGLQWQALPSLSFSLQAGGSYTVVVDNQTLITPYASAAVSWQLGKRSSLSFNYTHEVAPTDDGGASAATIDRLSAGFSYDISTFLNAHLQGVYTNEQIDEQFVTQSENLAIVNDQFVVQQQNNTENFSGNEKIYTVDAGLTYHYNNYLDFDAGLAFSGVQSDFNIPYDRQQVYLGVRGTY